MNPSLDAQVLAHLGERGAFEQHYGLLNVRHLTAEAASVFTALPSYYDYLAGDQVDWEHFASWYTTLYRPGTGPLLHGLLTSIAEASRLGAPFVPRTLAARHAATSIAEEAMRVALNEPASSMDRLVQLVEAYTATTAPLGASLLTGGMQVLLEDLDAASGLVWRLGALNKSLGPIRRGDLVLFGARPETGKTTLLASEATFMAGALSAGQTVLWFNNEEDSRRVKMRCIQAALGATRAEVLADPRRTKQRYVDALGDWDRIVFCDTSGLAPSALEAVLKRYDVGLIIFDQLRKVRMPGNAEGVHALAAVFQWARTLAKTYAPVITVHQANGDAANVMYPDDYLLEGCRTEIQGELDAQVMIGRVNTPGSELIRGLNVVKNKLPAPGLESMRHGTWQVRIQPEIARFI